MCSSAAATSKQRLVETALLGAVEEEGMAEEEEAKFEFSSLPFWTMEARGTAVKDGDEYTKVGNGEKKEGEIGQERDQQHVIHPKLIQTFVGLKRSY